jgi:hypothetical protein
MTEQIEFVGLDGKNYTFKTETNSLNNAQMWTLNDWHTCYVGTKASVKKIMAEILNIENLGR